MPKLVTLDPSLPWVVYLRQGKIVTPFAAFARRDLADSMRKGFNQSKKPREWSLTVKRKKR